MPADPWEAWWELQRYAFLLERTASPTTVTESEASGVGRSGSGSTGLRGDERAREALARERLVPLLLATLPPSSGAEDPVRAAAAVALGRTTRDAGVIPVLFAVLEDRSAATAVRTGAAIGLGLLRRDDPDERFDGRRLDGVRERLLEAVADDRIPDAAREAAAVAVGMLGDQPWSDDPFAKDGRLVVHAIWSLLGRDHASAVVPAALLTALGMQPYAGVPEGVWQDLKRIALGLRTRDRAWGPRERESAIAAVGALGGPGSATLLTRLATSSRGAPAFRAAALLALAERSDAMDADERVDAARALLERASDARDVRLAGLLHVALGRLLDADLRAGSTTLLERSSVPRLLLRDARDGPLAVRGFSGTALAWAARNAGAGGRTSEVFREEAEQTLIGGLSRADGDDRLRGAFAAALGVLGSPAGVAPLVAVVEDRERDPALRGHAAMALAQIGAAGPAVERALGIALAEPGSPALFGDAALAMSLLRGNAGARHLERALRAARNELALERVTVALAWLRDAATGDALLALARDPSRDASTRALALLSLSRLADSGTASATSRRALRALLPDRLRALRDASGGT